MNKLNVIFWSQTGNTEIMAKAVKAGIIQAGKGARVMDVLDTSPEDVKDVPVFALGCPAMGYENLEESEMEPFVAEVEKFAAGKKIALFGSYEWGDGQWMRSWEARMRRAGAQIIGGKGLICRVSPDAGSLADCYRLGIQMANL